MSCTICNHPKRPEIDQALIAGSSTLTALGQEYGLSTSALHRHKAHLQAKVNRAKDQLQDNLRQGCIFWLSQALEMTMQTAKAAQAEGDGKIVLQAVSQVTRLIKIILKQDLHLDDRVIYAILASPEWSTQAGLLPEDPRIMAMSRQYLAETLSSPCPETPDSAPSPAPLSDQDLDQLQAMFPSLGQPLATQPQPENRKLKTKNRHQKGWEKSGNLPGKTTLVNNNTKKHQIDTLLRKNSTQNAKTVIEELAGGRLDIATLNAIGAGRSFPEPLAIFQDAGSPLITDPLGKVF
jgi:hypothetical protein